jgi:hypothetical protein
VIAAAAEMVFVFSAGLGGADIAVKQFGLGCRRGWRDRCRSEAPVGDLRSRST